MTINTPTICRRPISTVKYGASSNDAARQSADIVLKVTSWPVEEPTLAWASYCVLDQYGRPIAGHINIGPNSLAAATSDEEVFSTLVHETMHALGFSANRFTKFQSPSDGSLYTPVNAIKLGSGAASKSTFAITSPKVRQFAREHFDCDELVGMELEDYDEQSRGPGSHWEERLLGPEVMTPVTDGRSATFVSAITLALFEDIGYFPNYTRAQSLGYGRGKGCAFAQASPNGNSRGAGYVAAPGNQCSADRLGFSLCQWYEYEQDLPAWSRPDAANPRRGGAEYADFVVEPGISASCAETPKNLGVSRGYTYGAASRCFASSVISKGYVVQAPSVGCYEQRCVDDHAEVNVDGTWIKCPVAGGDAVAPSKSFGGAVVCASADELCCLKHNKCSARGTCNRGACVCDDGYGGQECEKRLSAAQPTSDRATWPRPSYASEESPILQPKGDPNKVPLDPERDAEPQLDATVVASASSIVVSSLAATILVAMTF